MWHLCEGGNAIPTLAHQRGKNADGTLTQSIQHVIVRDNFTIESCRICSWSLFGRTDSSLPAYQGGGKSYSRLVIYTSTWYVDLLA